MAAARVVQGRVRHGHNWARASAVAWKGRLLTSGGFFLIEHVLRPRLRLRKRRFLLCGERRLVPLSQSPPSKREVATYGRPPSRNRGQAAPCSPGAAPCSPAPSAAAPRAARAASPARAAAAATSAAAQPARSVQSTHEPSPASPPAATRAPPVTRAVAPTTACGRRRCRSSCTRPLAPKVVPTQRRASSCCIAAPALMSSTTAPMRCTAPPPPATTRWWRCCCGPARTRTRRTPTVRPRHRPQHRQHTVVPDGLTTVVQRAGDTGLMAAACNGHAKVLEQLLDAGAACATAHLVAAATK